MGSPAGLTPQTPETCRYRKPDSAAGAGAAECGLLKELLADLAGASPQVELPDCEACCRSFPPSPSALNPVISSLLYGRAHDLLQSGCVSAGQALARRAERFLDIVASGPPATTNPASIDARFSPSLLDLLPFPRRRCGPVVRHWAVGVTTAPRRQATLERCLDSLVRAGWPRPVLLADGSVAIAERFRCLPSTCRDEPVGAWPHYYFAMTELLMREPLADAYMLVQDDALFFDRENVREYLSEMLWPGSTPGIVSLYCAQPDQQARPGWERFPERWRSGAVALIFPRHILIELLHDEKVLAHRWSPEGNGLVAIPETIAEWAERRGVPFYFPTPSLVQHIGAASAIWNGSYELTPARQAGLFAGDLAVEISSAGNTGAAGDLDPAKLVPASIPFHIDRSAAAFAEKTFPCRRARARHYASCVARGRRRMQTVSAVICALCREVVHCLPATAARIERLAGMFARCQTVIFENDSRDATAAWLAQWAAVNSSVHVISERLGTPVSTRGTGLDRTSRMAYCRNRCRLAALSVGGDFDFVIVLDTDLEGGFSYDGIAHTFGVADWDFVGSCGLSHDPQASGDGPHYAHYAHYDAFAFRSRGQSGVSDFRAVNRLNFRRGDPLVPVWSCFGGLGIYRMECFRQAQYEGDDCEHVTFHRALRALGYDRLFLNPSQIVCYTAPPVFSEPSGDSGVSRATGRLPQCQTPDQTPQPSGRIRQDTRPDP